MNVETRSCDKNYIDLVKTDSILEDKKKCSLKEEGIIRSCDECGLKCVCDGISMLSIY
ncbi:hypothetical protein [Clostridium saccharobutylicum]|uniref:Uncharacterized protein n=1 Tax=Clostridium saccharobutylicum DSM 13864 TaxID=1345695 RepID=U5MST6_CLOSA|nr:hypothetical protein [Clostridium saccharobutylicum]AGX42492.1 hypothetical protein CLSA_c14920 [Clostridium saccharobutylicum DSM 13864]AQR89777.1 hypothetical protein CLOSC_14800 [Clostridium saccharobutylicum]AQR99679.1 hypothetical protein CSACC_14880 [Clostridium saccharobutylicum]AQS09409.1 hypothetical protein CLOBY_15360 [Clostridium saccharobutylicum]AQS13665.1 hypothetical protein CLOSACC_14880 [Clostridium saccharobutylicum]